MASRARGARIRTSAARIVARAGDQDRSGRELVAEGMRAYNDNPNAFKTMAPEAAKLIREHFNNNPKINRTLQFSTIGGFSALPLLNQPPSDQ